MGMLCKICGKTIADPDVEAGRCFQNGTYFFCSHRCYSCRQAVKLQYPFLPDNELNEHPEFEPEPDPALQEILDGLCAQQEEFDRKGYRQMSPDVAAIYERYHQEQSLPPLHLPNELLGVLRIENGSDVMWYYHKPSMPDRSAGVDLKE